MSTIKYILTFVTGAGVGVAVTYKLVKDKEERRAQDEINEMKKHIESIKAQQAKINMEKDYTDIVKEYKPDKKSSDEPVDYTDFYDPDAAEEIVIEDASPVENPEIFAIPVEEFDSDETFDKRTLTLYSDGVLADDQDKVVNNIDELIGEEMFEYFKNGKSQEEYIRNEILGMDYELLKVSESYEDLVAPPEEDIDED